MPKPHSKVTFPSHIPQPHIPKPHFQATFPSHIPKPHIPKPLSQATYFQATIPSNSRPPVFLQKCSERWGLNPSTEREEKEMIPSGICCSEWLIQGACDCVIVSCSYWVFVILLGIIFYIICTRATWMCFDTLWRKLNQSDLSNKPQEAVVYFYKMVKLNYGFIKVSWMNHISTKNAIVDKLITNNKLNFRQTM